MDKIGELQEWFNLQLKNYSIPQEPIGLYDPFRYIMELGGKRLRPVLALVGAEAVGGKAPQALGAALAVEVFHNFSLVHDDIMDQAPLRRGQPAVHTKWDVSTAILTGDVMLVKAYDCLLKLPHTILPEAMGIFGRTAREVCEGQILDMEFEKRTRVMESEYIQMIQYKTSVLLGASLQLGALAGGAAPSVHQGLYRFGLFLGTAFQIQDDWLDCFGNPEQVGKQPGGDILANKKTLLRIAAMDLGSAGQKSRLLELDTHQGPKKVEEVKAIYQETGADNYAKEVMKRYHLRALDAMKMVVPSSGWQKELEGFSHFLINRSH